MRAQRRQLSMLLRRVAMAMAAEVRPGDILARIGGDEFVALLVNCDARGAEEVRDRLLKAVAALNLPWGSASISVGIAVGKPGDPAQRVLADADVAPYRHKDAR